MAAANGGTECEGGDERIKAVLRQATELAGELDPLFTWEELCEIVAEWCVSSSAFPSMIRLLKEPGRSSRLGLLKRHPRLEALYVDSFNPLVKSVHGSTESYLRKQLGWGREPQREEEEEREYWTRGAVTNVRLNDWPYAVPKDVRCVLGRYHELERLC